MILFNVNLSKKLSVKSCRLLILLFSLSLQKKVKLKLISLSLFEKYLVSTPLVITKHWIYLYNPLYECFLYLSIWLKASFKSNPLLFSSIWTRGSPFIRIVTSYLFVYLFTIVTWFVTWKLFFEWSSSLKNSI